MIIFSWKKLMSFKNITKDRRSLCTVWRILVILWKKYNISYRKVIIKREIKEMLMYKLINGK